MLSSEKTFKRKNCIEDVQVEIEKLLEQEFIVEIKQVDHNVPEWYLPMQAVLTPDRTTKLRLVYDASAKGQNGKSLNDHLEKGRTILTVYLTFSWLGASIKLHIPETCARCLIKFGSTQIIKYSTDSYGEQTKVNSPECISGSD